MKLTHAVIAAMVTLGLGTTLSAQEPQSVWSGIYTEEQAGRGKPLYNQECAECHGLALEGAEMAPALANDDFRWNWNGLSVGDLFERMRVSMPQDNPLGMTRSDKADVLAYILQQNEFPTGDSELLDRTEQLTPIMIEAVKP